MAGTTMVSMSSTRGKVVIDRAVDEMFVDRPVDAAEHGWPWLRAC